MLSQSIILWFIATFSIQTISCGSSSSIKTKAGDAPQVGVPQEINQDFLNVPKSSQKNINSGSNFSLTLPPDNLDYDNDELPEPKCGRVPLHQTQVATGAVNTSIPIGKTGLIVNYCQFARAGDYSGVGVGWMLALDRYILPVYTSDPGSLTVIEGSDLSETEYLRDNRGGRSGYIPVDPKSSKNRLDFDGPDRMIERRPDHWKYLYSRTTANDGFRLKEIKDANDRVIVSITRNNYGYITSISDRNLNFDTERLIKFERTPYATAPLNALLFRYAELKITDADGSIYTIKAKNSSGQIDSISYPHATGWQFHYQGTNESLMISGSPGIVRMTYTESSIFALEFSYEAPSGRVVRMSDGNGMGEVTTIHYGKNTVTVRTPFQEVIQTFNSDKQLVKISTESSESNLDWTTDHRLVTHVDPLGRKTTFEYGTSTDPERSHLPSKISFPDGTQINYSYYDDGENIMDAQSIYNTSSINRHFEYDSKNRLSLTSVNAISTRIGRDANGNVTNIVHDVIGPLFSAKYDDRNRLIEWIDESGLKTNSDWSSDNKLRIISPVGNASTTTYDQMGRAVAHSTLTRQDNLSYDSSGLRAFSSTSMNGTSVTTEFGRTYFPQGGSISSKMTKSYFQEIKLPNGHTIKYESSPDYWTNGKYNPFTGRSTVEFDGNQVTLRNCDSGDCTVRPQANPVPAQN